MFDVVRLGSIMGPKKEQTRSSDIQPMDTSTLSFTGRIANWSAHHRWWVVAASVLVIVLAMFVMNTVETKTLDYNGEGEASIGAKLIDERFTNDSPPTEQLVFSNPSLDASDPVFRTTVEELVQQLRALPEVTSVTSFYDTEASSMVSEDGHVVLAQVVLDREGKDEDKIDSLVKSLCRSN